MLDYKEIRKLINSAKMSIRKAGSSTRITDSVRFRGMPMSVLDNIQEMMAEDSRKEAEAFALKCGTGKLETLGSCIKRAERQVGIVFDALTGKQAVTASEIYKTLKSPERMRDIATGRMNVQDAVMNGRFNIGNHIDPTVNSMAVPNIYISPWEASTLYSQKGIFETVINKKAKSILLNGISFKNSRLTQKEIDKVKEKMQIHDFKGVISDSVRDSLVYGGNLTFPMFRRDTPVTTGLPLSALLKLGVLGKDCLDYFVQLDRWNTLIIPPYNPTQKDFLEPDVYTIPFLGSDVHHTRTARVVTARQAGYLGQVVNMGWGISDFCGYLQSGLNYKVTIQALPLMIQQMSILARTVNVDGVLVTEGANALDALVENNTIRTREASPDNPITMDVLGNITAINRNFAQVPELIRLERQDFSADAGIPEPMLFSSEKGNFSSGDDTQGNLNKQWENIKMIHKDVETQLKQLVKIMVIDALGTDDHVIKALPYVQLSFDEPVVANALERAQIGKFFSENVFNLVSARLPIDVSVEMASEHISDEFSPSADLLDKLREIQAKGDANDEERFRLEMEQMEAGIEQTKASTERMEEAGTETEIMKTGTVNGKKGTSKKEDKATKGKSPAEEQREMTESDKGEPGYSRLEQKQHEKTRAGFTKRSEKMAKARNKGV